MKKNKNKQNKYILQKINISIVCIFAVLYVILVYFLGNNKSLFITVATIASIYIFFLHCFLLTKSIKNHLLDIKQEAKETNHIINCVTFFASIFIILFLSSALLLFAGEKALNITIISLYYISNLSMLVPAIVVIAYMIFVVPIFIVPGLTVKSYYQANRFSLLLVLIILFSVFCFCKFAIDYLYNNNFITQIKYKIEKMSVDYSKNFLEINQEKMTKKEQRIIENTKAYIPFLYTKQNFFFKNYDDARMFCDSLNARIPNYIETFYIAFQKFDTFGENYYWTSSNEDKEPFLIHFHNMKYTLERYDDSKAPLLYCVSNLTQEEKSKLVRVRKYFIRQIKKDIKQANYKAQQESMEELSLLSKLNNQPVQQPITQSDNISNIDLDKKSVSFSVKEVSVDYMKSLLEKGYIYNPTQTLNSSYEVTDFDLMNKITRDPNKKQIRFCHYPFTDYGTITIDEEAQIWKQSFCSPAFELIQSSPKATSVFEKELYCSSLGGRLPNIPELMGILKTLSIQTPGIKYWTNNSVRQNSTGVTYPISVHFKDSRFLVPNFAGTNDRAYAYCIRPANKPSKLISNYKSRFKDMNGQQYATSICPDCKYHEIPDVVLQKK